MVKVLFEKSGHIIQYLKKKMDGRRPLVVLEESTEPASGRQENSLKYVHLCT